MRFDPRILDDIRARISVSQLIGRTVALKRQGREFAALSPFNAEKTPSFFVNDEKQFYHCFSSGRHGDIFSWLMETEGLSFREAVERLAGEAGVALPEEDPKAAQARVRAHELSDVMALAAEWFRTALEGSRGADARRYLEQRGVSRDVQAEFGLGFAPGDRRGLLTHLTRAGLALSDLDACGLVITPDQGDAYDRFRDRIMFPIADIQGRIIAFGGRALAKGAPAKYLNSPETTLFHKGETLYRYREARAGLAAAERAAAAAAKGERHGREPGGLVVVEGYMDVIALAGVGIASAVAPLGTAVTESQLELLWRAGPEPVMCFDGDAAGLRAAHRVVERALGLIKPGRSVRFALLPAGQDPDDLVRQHGRDAFTQCIANAKSLNDMVWDMVFAEGPFDTPERKARLRQRIFEVCAVIPNESLKKDYQTALFNKFYDTFRRRADDGRRAPAQNARRRGDRRGNAPGPTAESKAQATHHAERARDREAKRLLRALLVKPEILPACVEALTQLDLADEGQTALREALLAYEDAQAPLDTSALSDHLATMGLSGVAGPLIEEQASKHAPVFREDASVDEAATHWLTVARGVQQDQAQQAERADLLARIMAARNSGDREEMTRALRALSVLRTRQQEVRETGLTGLS